MPEPARLICLYPATQTTDVSVCRDPKMKLRCHFSEQPFSKNHILCMPIHWYKYSQSAHFLTDSAGTGKDLEAGPRHSWLLVRKGQPAFPQGGPWAYLTELRGLGGAQHKKTPDKRNHTVYGKKREHSQASETTFTFSEPRLNKLSTKQISKRNREKSPFPARLSVNGTHSSARWLAQHGCVHTRPFKSSSFD